MNNLWKKGAVTSHLFTLCLNLAGVIVQQCD